MPFPDSLFSGISNAISSVVSIPTTAITTAGGVLNGAFGLANSLGGAALSNPALTSLAANIVAPGSGGLLAGGLGSILGGQTVAGNPQMGAQTGSGASNQYPSEPTKKEETPWILYAVIAFIGAKLLKLF